MFHTSSWSLRLCFHVVIVLALLVLSVGSFPLSVMGPLRPPDVCLQPSSSPFRSIANRRRTTTMILWMGKGDGKTKKPKKKKKNQRPTAAAASSRSSTPATPAPQRVSNQINIPIRKQIAFAKQHRQQQQSPQRFRAARRTKYRRTEEEVQLAVAARGPQDPDWNVITNTTSGVAPLLLVDGYNIVFAWARLKKHMVRGDTERARQLLVDDLESLRSLKGWRIECVFDGRKSPTSVLGTSTPRQNGDDNTVISRSISKYGVRVVYTGSAVEADTYIESRCALAKNVTEGKLTGSLIVATDDAMIRMAGANAGAHCMGAERLVTELKAVRKGIAYKVELAVAQANGKTGTVRPEQLWGTSMVSPKNKCAVKDVAAERRRRKEERERDRIRAKQLLETPSSNEEGSSDIPEWAQLPNRTSWHR